MSGLPVHFYLGPHADTIDPLLGSQPDENTVKEMQDIIMAHKAVLGIHDIIIYNYGPGRTFATFHAEVDARSDLVSIHDTVDHIEREIMDRLRITTTCHIDPVKVNDPEWQMIHDRISKALYSFDVVEGFHDLRVTREKNIPILRTDVVVTPGKPFSKEEIQNAAEAAVRKAGLSYKVSLDFDQAYTVTQEV